MEQKDSIAHLVAASLYRAVVELGSRLVAGRSPRNDFVVDLHQTRKKIHMLVLKSELQADHCIGLKSLHAKHRAVGTDPVAEF